MHMVQYKKLRLRGCRVEKEDFLLMFFRIAAYIHLFATTVSDCRYSEF